MPQPCAARCGGRVVTTKSPPCLSKMRRDKDGAPGDILSTLSFREAQRRGICCSSEAPNAPALRGSLRRQGSHDKIPALSLQNAERQGRGTRRHSFHLVIPRSAATRNLLFFGSSECPSLALARCEGRVVTTKSPPCLSKMRRDKDGAPGDILSILSFREAQRRGICCLLGAPNCRSLAWLGMSTRP
jgi:hypothetical protein